MTARPRGTPLSSAVPASQHTAPVNEFRCLFTHDVRRKQKRWQDGNFLGDTYWKESDKIQEGDELQLDKGVMVEVAEALGITQTDLTALLEKKKDASQPQPKTTVPRSTMSQRPVPTPSLLARGPSQLRHKSLNTLLGASKGPIGKAIPIESPFETRKKKQLDEADEREAKRQKKMHGSTYPKTSASMTIPEPGVSTAKPSVVASGQDKASRIAAEPPSQDNSLFDVDLDTDDRTSDLAPLSTPPPISKPPRIPKGKVPVPHVKAMQTPKPARPPSSPPISASNRIANIDYALQPSRSSLLETESPSSTRIAQMERSKVASPPPKKTKTLRLSTGVRRGMLLCQSITQPPVSVSRRQDEDHVRLARATSRKSRPARKMGCDDAHTIILEDEDTGDDYAIESESLQRPKSGKRQIGSLAESNSEKTATRNGPAPELASDMEIAHGIMDQQLAVSPSPPSFHDVRKPERSPRQNERDLGSAVGASTSSKRNRHQADTGLPDVPHQSKRSKIATNSIIERESLQDTNLEGAPQQVSKKGNPDLLEQVPQRIELPIKNLEQNTTPSIHPKERLLSLGGFRKKPKQAHSSLASDKSSNASSLRHAVASGNNPSAPNVPDLALKPSTSSTSLTKPPKPITLDNDLIEDDIQIVSLDRSFRRTRSENDAPIPSISEEWEKQNLPKPLPINGTGTEDAPNASTTSLRPKPGGLAALVKRTDPRRKFQRTRSLNENASLTNVTESMIVDAPPDTDVGPWSTEAFDLFDWRPPAPKGQDQGTGLLTDRR
ncbi:unnamed protein product [Periconia digitata]|uniref:5'-3' DNA helicase ZGRF1-like N-terminal domain-containing protein n=1 Tax=Periconia digitata TaxID=1303443 RepID=A0A9W4UKF3_9PLEO|nr:unnamed protein product [Periconia digitata]